MSGLSWMPHHGAGGLYCSPACGCGCTEKQFVAAHAAGRALATKLGPGWRYRVWENAGWHTTAVKGVVRVLPNTGKAGGTVYFDGVRQFSADYDIDPRAGVRRVYEEAKEYARQLTCQLNEVQP